MRAAAGPPADVDEIVDVIGSHFRQRVEVHADISPLGIHGDAEVWRGDVTAVDISGRNYATNLHPNLVGSVLRTVLGVALLALPFALAAARARMRQKRAREVSPLPEQSPQPQG